MKVEEFYLPDHHSISQYATLLEAAQVFEESGDSDLMVVDDQDQLIGIVSEGDLIRYCMPNYRKLLDDGLLPDEAFDLILEKGPRYSNESVKSIAVTNVIYVTPETPLYKAASYMSSKNIRKLPVVRDEKLVGTISRGSIARVILKMNSEESEDADKDTVSESSSDNRS